jgi:cytoskeletal protein RodZ
MDSLGKYLLTLREEKNISLETVYKDIKLTVDQVSAIETNRLSVLGNHGFARAMVYTYVRYLAADEKTAMYLFDISWPPQKQTNFTPKKPLKEQKVLISTNFIWLIGIMIIVIVLGSIIWISYTKGYLRRPFDKLNQSKDNAKTELQSVPQPTKQDTLRERMLKIAHSSIKSKLDPNKKPKTNKINNKFTSADSTDYLDTLIFGRKDSPFNSRF